MPWDGGIPQDRRAREIRDRLFEELQALRAQFGQHDRNAGHVSSRPPKARDEPTSHGVGAARHHDWDGRGRLHSGADSDRDIGNNDVRLETHQFRGERG
jgi:hypothetical protein